MKWVKASERLPDNGLVHFRNIHGLNDVVFYKSGLGFYKPKIVGRNDRGLAITENEVLKYSLDIIEWLDESTPEGVSAVEFLRSKKILWGDKTKWIITFSDGREVELGNLLSEYASLVSASKDEEIARLKDDVKELVGCMIKLERTAPVRIGANMLESPATLEEYFNTQEESKQLIQKHKL